MVFLKICVINMLLNQLKNKNMTQEMLEIKKQVGIDLSLKSFMFVFMKKTLVRKIRHANFKSP